ncbi:MAG TPA: hypothetical protein VIJ31_16030 [Acidothermaceae bacterium]
MDPLVSPDVEHEVRDIRDVVTLALEAAVSKMVQVDLEVLELTNAEIDRGNLPGKHRVTLREVRPDGALPIDPLDFTEPGVIAALVAEGRRDAERMLDATPVA